MDRQTVLFEDIRPVQGTPTTTFARNMKLPVHGWFRFPAGFSADWVLTVITAAKAACSSLQFLDPFAGVGTAVLSGEEAGVRAVGLEAQPFIERIAAAKLLWHTPVAAFRRKGKDILARAKERSGPLPDYPPLIEKCFPREVLAKLHNLRTAWEECADAEPSSELTWLALTSVLRRSAPVGTAPWQYILPNKTSKSLPPLRTFEFQVGRMAADMQKRQAAGIAPTGRMAIGDARDCAAVETSSVDLVVTSPPYANNYDYADATRFEMSFFGLVESWSDLQNVARKNLVRSCSQYFSSGKSDLGDLLLGLSGTPIREEIEKVCSELAGVRLARGGRKDYHLMVAAYFEDMRRVWQALRRVCKPGAVVCFVVGDSAPYGIYVPVHDWLGKLAVYAGFADCRFERIRDRNVKWRNRKHRVPLCEGNLWVRG